MRYKGINSRELLKHVVLLLKEKGFTVGNVDATVICEAPKLSPHTAQMCANIAADCQVAVSQINVKATTTEKLGFTGRGEGIAAEAVCLIGTISNNASTKND
jgi:2-C-methyl-D-erythritol 2,4-cyclodiphosphate synthase